MPAKRVADAAPHPPLGQQDQHSCSSGQEAKETAQSIPSSPAATQVPLCAGS